MARNSDIERLTARVNRLCRTVSPPQLDVNVWQEGEDGKAPTLIYTTARNRAPDVYALDILIEGNEEDAHS